MENKLLEHIKEIFLDADLADRYYRQGYFVLPDFINKEVVEKLNALQSKYAPGVSMRDKPIYSNLEENPIEINKQIEEEILNAFSRSMSGIIKDYKLYGGSFLIKGYGEKTQTNLHQDWCAVDESAYPSFSIWVPLQDVTEDSGCMVVVPGSHLWRESIRSINFQSLYVPLAGEAEKYTVRLPVKAGTAVIFSMNLFHGSFPNLQSHSRGAVHLALTHRDADLRHYIYRPASDDFAVVKCEKDFLYNFIFDLKDGTIPNSAIISSYLKNAGNMRITEHEWFKLVSDHLTLANEKNQTQCAFSE